MTDKPHDALFRTTFSQLDHAASELQSVLPPELTARIDWATLCLEPGSFVSEELEGRVTDLLYSAQLEGGHPIRLLVLFEHQSTDQPRMALRLLDYMVAIWRRIDAEHGSAEPLPPILPVVLHNGESSWSAPRSLRDLFRIPDADWEGLSPFIPDFRYLLDDLAIESAEQIHARPMPARVRLVLWCLARARDPGFVDEVPLFRDAFLEVLATADPEGAFTAIVRYVYLVSDVEPELLESALAPQAQEAVVSTADKLHERGRRQGIDEGCRQTLAKLLQLKFGELSPAHTARLNAASSTELDRWTERVLSASTLDELFEA